MLAVVVYNGSAHWGAATALAELVGEGTRPLAGTASAGPRFTGESYVLVDVGAYRVEKVPAGNLVSLVMAAEGMAGPGDAADVLEEALRLLVRQVERKLGTEVADPVARPTE